MKELPGHRPRYGRRILGGKPVGRGNIYGATVRCSCGWRQQSNEDQKHVERLFQRHLDEVGTWRFGFGPARVI